MLAGRDVLTLIPISEPGRSRVFYEEILGLPFVADDGFALVFAVNDRWLRLTKTGRPFTPQPFSLLSWMVDDIQSVVRGLIDRGVVFTRYPGLEQDALGIWQPPGHDAHVAWFEDPDGNILSLVQSSPQRP